MERLQKKIAKSNIASRRAAEKMILDGRVSVNGIIVNKLGVKVSDKDEIKVDNKIINSQNLIYILLNKPTGYLSSNKDDKSRKIITDLIKDELKDLRVYPIGRLDYDVAGLILLTNDGNLTNKLTDSNLEIEKEYFIRIKGIVIRKKIVELRDGILLEDGKKFMPIEVNLAELNKENQSTLIRLVLREDRNEIIKKAIAIWGYKIKGMTRTSYSFLSLNKVARGKFRHLSPHEVKKIYSLNTKK